MRFESSAIQTIINSSKIMERTIENYPLAWCLICKDEKLCDEVHYLYDLQNSGTRIETGNKKNCPGCDGVGISKRAIKYRLDNQW